MRRTQIPLIFIFLAYWAYFFRQKPWVILIGIGLPCLPTAVDVFLRKCFELRDTGFINLFCFYTDPSHDCGYNIHINQLYNSQKPSNTEVLQNYLQYVFLDEGLRHILENVIGVLAKNLIFIPKFWFVSTVFLGFGMYVSNFQMWKRYGFWVLYLFVIPFIISLLYYFDIYIWYVVLLYTILIYFYVLYQKYHLSFILISVYIFGSLFLTANGIFGHDGRYNGSIQIFFFLGYYTVITEDIIAIKPDVNYTISDDWKKYIYSWFIGLGLAIFFLIYSSSFYLFKDIKNTDNQDFIRVSHEKIQNRTLIYHPKYGVGYIQYLEGDLSQYTKLHCPDGFANNSFKKPCHLE